MIYIENQYLTTSAIVDAVERRLAEPDGAEIAIVLPRRCHGWLEETALAGGRARGVDRLRSVDHQGRLRLLYPIVSGAEASEDVWVRVHAKVLVIDDRLLRVGSSARHPASS
jgi:phosphatidylserine/phosphatidylglycerophosphate/cardiolipin synthase-like enzyme